MQPAERKKSWTSKRVFFLTPQVLMNDLSRQALPALDVKCLVVDEAHKALGNHAYCQVSESYYSGLYGPIFVNYTGLICLFVVLNFNDDAHRTNLVIIKKVNKGEYCIKFTIYRAAGLSVRAGGGGILPPVEPDVPAVRTG